MRPSRIQISGVFSTLIALILPTAGCLLPATIEAQCSGTLGTTTYTTTFSSATGNTSFTYNLPLFPVSSLTLYAVSIRSVVSVSSNMSLTNNTGSTVNATGRLYRTDDFFTGVSSDDNIPTFGSVFNAPSLANGATKTFAFQKSINNVNLVDSIYPGDASGDNPSAFLGSGTTPLTYNTGTTVLTNPNNPLMVGTAPTVSDQMIVTVTYYWCNPGTLATDILTFTAVRENDQTALLNWTTSNQEPGRNYVLQVSTDGSNFADSATIPAQGASGDAVYSYTYPLRPNATGNLYFRLRVVDLVGPPHFSQICLIKLGDGAVTNFSIYPNPPNDFINLSFPGGNQNWNVEIFAADGNLIQRNYFPTTNLVRVNFNHKMATGTYFVRAANPQTNQTYSRSFVINNNN
jgi:hypothetical protein